MVVCMLIAAASVNAVVWDVNNDLDPNYWPDTEPVMGAWSMGWAWVDSPWNVVLFEDWYGELWGNSIWLTDDDSWTYPLDPAYHLCRTVDFF